jgi:hypothetical protein
MASHLNEECQSRISTEDFSDLSEPNEADDDDAELQELVERSFQRFIGLGSSRSAHANLAQMVGYLRLSPSGLQSFLAIFKAIKKHLAGCFSFNSHQKYRNCAILRE